ncbi:hypothetical protein COT94_03280 [Candidatus Falkowbacteria bacterium CG10_big_fil_rev_8_21_14_0_10_37_14]|uniref:FCP1 homology domain-containing protein n=1 Tax=Candidatus Falkowbacteria bacterium CG10_big_fil_rev_8_21_14_0_10_37_14 TaxID=1974561 RepID=A0A2M6WSX3_9BACT|nr:MAG: hypothetical protein COT94_03280 [Candidatus Falkowbacteria bacterium CG10_big_fil_rev_8_21_14_0_10_37_14]
MISKDSCNLICVVDIDGTIARGHLFHHLAYYNNQLNLKLTTDYISNASKLYSSTLKVPEIKKLADSKLKGFLEIRNEIHSSDELAFHLTPIPDSTEGTWSITKQTIFGGYYTARKCSTSITRKWLLKHHYPNPEKVVMVTNHRDKLIKIIENHLVGTTNKCLLIDDHPDDILVASHNLSKVKKYASYLNNIIIVGYSRLPDISLAGNSKVCYLENWKTLNLSKLLSEVSRL